MRTFTDFHVMREVENDIFFSFIVVIMTRFLHGIRRVGAGGGLIWRDGVEREMGVRREGDICGVQAELAGHAKVDTEDQFAEVVLRRKCAGLMWGVLWVGEDKGELLPVSEDVGECAANQWMSGGSCGWCGYWAG